MIYRLGLLVALAACASVTSALPPCVCTRELKPVCGSDGETYNNPCMLECQQQTNHDLQIRNHGSCRSVRDTAAKPICICTLEYRPVCASNGRTYPNTCNMKCESGDLEIVHYGNCRPKRETCWCPYNYAPVCGTDGKTYGNECSLKCENGIAVAHRGTCGSRAKRQTETCICPYIHSPVCGTDGKTYGNECSINCVGVAVAHKGACIYKPETCPDVCPAIYLPVCGTDGVTYPNDCTILCANGVSVAHKGACRDKPEKCPVACPAIYLPVCGSDGVTYPNDCVIQCTEDVHVAHKGECQREKREAVQVAHLPPLPACQCTREAFPVCGTDGRTYSNPCLLNCAREKNEDLHVDHPGSCKKSAKVREVKPQPSCSCARIMSPVCASDGRSYNNECLMRCAGEHLTVEKYGRCD